MYAYIRVYIYKKYYGISACPSKCLGHARSVGRLSLSLSLYIYIYEYIYIYIYIYVNVYTMIA